MDAENEWRPAVTQQPEPDDKNWTWVLERACPECGYESTVGVDQMGAAIRDLAIRWQIVLASGNARQRPQPAVWSPLEYGCHVRDVFRKFDERLNLMVSEVDPHFANWDQDQTAIDDRYWEQDSERVSEQLGVAAAALADRFDAVAPGEHERRGFRSDGSTFTIASFAQYLLHDPVHHLWDVGAEVPRY
jgi:hypothetical protein